MRKLAFVIALLLLCAMPVLADGTNKFVFEFTAHGTGVLPDSEIYKDLGLSFVATGYAHNNVETALWGSFAPGDEGLGLANGVNHEISGDEFIQLNLASILARNPVFMQLEVDALHGTTYDVYGSNTAGVLGKLIADNVSNVDFNLTGDKYQFISIRPEHDSGTVELEDLTVITTPEPPTLLLFGIGLAAMLLIGRSLTK